MRRSALGFALVGVLSTLTHVCVATVLIEWLGARALARAWAWLQPGALHWWPGRQA